MPYLVRMRTILRPAAAALVLFAALAATGCTPEPAKPHTPAPSSTPLFASDEEALAAAEEAYAAYVAVNDQVYEDGGVGAERLEQVATGAQLEADTLGMNEVARLGYHSSGKTSFDNISLQQYQPDAADGVSVVTVYLCQDVSGIDVFDPSGNSVVLETRPDRTKFEVSFDRADSASERSLLVSNRSPWSEQSC